MTRGQIQLVVVLVIIGFLGLFGTRFFVSVPAGHVAVATLFGKVQATPYEEGLNFPVNPLLDFVFFDIF